jgi:hypothetical protein
MALPEARYSAPAHANVPPDRPHHSSSKIDGSSIFRLRSHLKQIRSFAVLLLLLSGAQPAGAAILPPPDPHSRCALPIQAEQPLLPSLGGMPAGLEPRAILLIADGRIELYSATLPGGVLRCVGPPYAVLRSTADKAWTRLLEIVSGKALAASTSFIQYGNAYDTLSLQDDVKKRVLYELALVGATISGTLFTVPQLRTAMANLAAESPPEHPLLLHIYSRHVLLPWSLVYLRPAQSFLGKYDSVDQASFLGYRLRLASFTDERSQTFLARPLTRSSLSLLFAHYVRQDNAKFDIELELHKPILQSIAPKTEVDDGTTLLTQLASGTTFDMLYAFAHGRGGGTLALSQRLPLPTITSQDQGMVIQVIRDLGDVQLVFSPSSWVTPMDIRDVPNNTPNVGPAPRPPPALGMVVFLNACESATILVDPFASFPTAFLEIGAGAVLAPSTFVPAHFAQDYFLKFFQKLTNGPPTDLSTIILELNHTYLASGFPLSLVYSLFGNGLVNQ